MARRSLKIDPEQCSGCGSLYDKIDDDEIERKKNDDYDKNSMKKSQETFKIPPIGNDINYREYGPNNPLPHNNHHHHHHYKNGLPHICQRFHFNLQTKTVIRGMAWFLAIFMTVLIGAAVGSGHYTLTMYTYWNLTMVWLFTVWFLFSVYGEYWWLRILILYILPVVYGSAFVVMVVIVGILAVNGWLFVSQTIYGGGQATVGTIHAGDFMLHSVPYVIMMWAIQSGLLSYGRSVLGVYLRQELIYERQITYVIWWFFSPIVPLLFYIIFNNPAQRYQTDIPVIFWVFIVLVTILVHQFIIFCCFTSLSNHLEIEIPLFGGGVSSHHHFNHAPHDFHSYSKSDPIMNTSLHYHAGYHHQYHNPTHGMVDERSEYPLPDSRSVYEPVSIIYIFL